MREVQVSLCDRPINERKQPVYVIHGYGELLIQREKVPVSGHQGSRRDGLLPKSGPFSYRSVYNHAW